MSDPRADHVPDQVPDQASPASEHTPAAPSVAVSAPVRPSGSSGTRRVRSLSEPVKGAVVTVSDRCVSGERQDLSGPLAAELLGQHGVVVDEVVVVPDGVDSVRKAITGALAAGARVVLTTGGTGVMPRDLTPEATAPLLATRLEGVETQVRAHGLASTPLAGLSRGLVGVTSREADGALVVNAPGSRGGVRDTVAVVGPLVPHVLDQLGGGDH